MVTGKQKYLLITASIGALVILFSSFSAAKVTGRCDNCHTMHSSQSPISDVPQWTELGWTADQTPQNALVLTDCVGCHSSTGGETIRDIGEGDAVSRVPIVYNTTPPTHPLAGGNFYWVSQGDDTLGHNVFGISGQDTNLNFAPGDDFNGNAAVCTCHVSLATDPANNASGFPSGCEGRHVPSHHHDDGAYRFLRHPTEVFSQESGYYVEGIEDPDWEYDPGQSHNVYKGADEVASPHSWGSRLLNTHTMSAFCSGCHNDFHSMRQDDGWIRHPSDAILPDRDEYAGYLDYDPLTPVGKASPNESQMTLYEGGVQPGEDFVICLSCHRPHGSPYADMLRWDYLQTEAGSGGEEVGCFACHRDKN